MSIGVARLISARAAQAALRDLARADRREVLQRFFKTGPGEYGEGDVFLGATMPDVRAVAKLFRDLPRPEVRKLVRSKFHEDRMLGFVILTLQYKAARKDFKTRQAIFEFYLQNRAGANNWDLIDVTAPSVLGEWMWENPQARKQLYAWSQSKDLWERRLSILCTQAFIRRGHFQDTVVIAEKLLRDEEDLIHKAAGWMVRECGKRDPDVLRGFLRKYAGRMPRTMLRYAIEKLSPTERARWLAVKK